MPSKQPLPVLIVGAGPCGLVAALTLQQHGIPFIILEKASRAKLCSNTGAGFELSPSAVNIFKNELKVTKFHDISDRYGGLVFMTMDGELVRDAPTCNSEGVNVSNAESVTRADLQNLLLEQLFPTPEDEKGILQCGVAFESYQEDVVSGKVLVKLQGVETPIEGCALLGCDGIHSRVRKTMNEAMDDSLHFCNIVCYWGKSPVIEGSPLEDAINETQSYKDVGPSMVMGMSTHRTPGAFYMMPTNDHYVWAVFLSADEPPTNSYDFTRRGGVVLTEKEKKDLSAQFFQHGDFPVFRLLLEDTRAGDITEAGIFDREDMNLDYSSPGKLVVTLGDAAHPQNPFLGQGVNMAITDAFVCATRIADSLNKGKAGDGVPEAIALYDTKARREGVNKVVLEARAFADKNMLSSRFACWIMRMILKYVPMSWLLGSDSGSSEGYDVFNQDFVNEVLSG